MKIKFTVHEARTRPWEFVAEVADDDMAWKLLRALSKQFAAIEHVVLP
jgi:hypothetical protein